MFKKLTLVSSIAIAAALAVPAMAQTGAGPNTQVTSSPSAVDANKLIGRSIQNQADNATVGTIDSVMLDRSGKTRQVIVGVGGFLGVGKKDVAIDWNRLQISDGGRKVVMNADKDQLKAMPEYVWPKDQKHGSVYTANVATPTSSGSSGGAPVSTGTSNPR